MLKTRIGMNIWLLLNILNIWKWNWIFYFTEYVDIKGLKSEYEYLCNMVNSLYNPNMHLKSLTQMIANELYYFKNIKTIIRIYAQSPIIINIMHNFNMHCFWIMILHLFYLGTQKIIVKWHLFKIKNSLRTQSKNKDNTSKSHTKYKNTTFKTVINEVC